MKILFGVIIMAITFQSCDCMQHVSGKVIDAETKSPISNVKISKFRNENDTSLTDSTGNFEVNSISGGIFGCPPMKITIQKEGYETLERKGGGTIELTKTK